MVGVQLPTPGKKSGPRDASVGPTKGGLPGQGEGGKREGLDRPGKRIAVHAAALALAFASACSTSGLDFRRDERVEILAPPNHSTQILPVTVTWKATGFTVSGPDGKARDDAGYFAVFIDRAPQPPRQPLSYLAKDDEACRSRDGCPDAQWFIDHRIYPTTATSFVVEDLPTSSREDLQKFHEVTIIFLDGKGLRIGEGAFTVRFKVRRGA